MTACRDDGQRALYAVATDSAGVRPLPSTWCNPGMARGVLRRLAAFQAKTDDPLSDAQPGKILHEMRSGEMAALGEVPFGRYYGSVDATPLFVVLAAAYLRRTGDLAFIRTLAPHVDHALAWIERIVEQHVTASDGKEDLMARPFESDEIAACGIPSCLHIERGALSA